VVITGGINRPLGIKAHTETSIPQITLAALEAATERVADAAIPIATEADFAKVEAIMEAETRIPICTEADRIYAGILVAETSIPR